MCIWPPRTGSDLPIGVAGQCRETGIMSNRLNVQFSEKQRRALDELAEELDTTKAGVLKTALSLLHVALLEKKNGNNIGVVRDDKVVKEIVGILE